MVLINPKRFNQELFDKSIQRKGFYEMICLKIKDMQINENIYKGVGAYTLRDAHCENVLS